MKKNTAILKVYFILMVVVLFMAYINLIVAHETAHAQNCKYQGGTPTIYYNFNPINSFIFAFMNHSIEYTSYTICNGITDQAKLTELNKADGQYELKDYIEIANKMQTYLLISIIGFVYLLYWVSK